MYTRNCTQNILLGLEEAPIIFLNGARQVGKSTLAKEIIVKGFLQEYITLDDITNLSAAATSPQSFLEGLSDRIVIDEVQRVPELFLALKLLIDKARTPGKYLLTGSANVLLFPKIADSLAGRLEIHTLWPLSQGEIVGNKENFIDRCFAEKDKMNTTTLPITWQQLVEKMVIGGYPEVLTRKDDARRFAWFNSYLLSILQRDIQDLANIERIKELPNLIALLASRAGGLLNFADISRASGIAATSLKRYLALLEKIFLFVAIPAWFRNLEKRLVKAPKIYLNDSGLLCHMQGINSIKLLKNHNFAGHVLENFVAMELVKQQGWNETKCRLYHFRSQAGQEVDFLLEAYDGRVVGIEVKSSNEVSTKSFAGLMYLSELLGDNFVKGIVLYTGERVVKFAKNLFAIPIANLWQK